MKEQKQIEIEAEVEDIIINTAEGTSSEVDDRIRNVVKQAVSLGIQLGKEELEKRIREVVAERTDNMHIEDVLYLASLSTPKEPLVDNEK
jgi:flagellar basal body-associated protein FliL